MFLVVVSEQDEKEWMRREQMNKWGEKDWTERNKVFPKAWVKSQRLCSLIHSCGRLFWKQH